MPGCRMSVLRIRVEHWGSLEPSQGYKGRSQLKSEILHPRTGSVFFRTISTPLGRVPQLSRNRQPHAHFRPSSTVGWPQAASRTKDACTCCERKATDPRAHRVPGFPGESGCTGCRPSCPFVDRLRLPVRGGEDWQPRICRLRQPPFLRVIAFRVGGQGLVVGVEMDPGAPDARGESRSPHLVAPAPLLRWRAPPGENQSGGWCYPRRFRVRRQAGVPLQRVAQTRQQPNRRGHSTRPQDLDKSREETPRSRTPRAGDRLVTNGPNLGFEGVRSRVNGSK